jgi:hypothetical protein|tara:strand:+ start:2467 stop:2769 length:303 start_codon:yes stop_codon:yes gene_type:complete
MKIGQLIKAFKNIDKISEGAINTFFKKQEVEIISDSRMHICNRCTYLDLKGKSCLVPGTQPCCSECGCSLEFKTRSLSSECPKGKWKAWLTEEEEEKLEQ